MRSSLENGTNIGRQEYVSVDQLVGVVADVAGREDVGDVRMYGFGV
jgi:hypothetical protein